MGTPSRFDDNEYKNWLKCSLALILFKEGLHDYIDTKVKNLHADIHHTVSAIVGPSVQNQCYTCTWQDIKWNKGTWTINCQSQICDRWLSEILANHTNPQNRYINWKNADITRWPTDPYEVTKIYMPKGQDQTKNLPRDLDAPAILSLLKYCLWFSQKIPNTSIVSDLIDIRNEVMHTGDLRVTDFKKDVCIDKMVQLLCDLNIHGHVLTELQKTKREDIDINFRETEVRALHGVLEQLTDDLDTVQTTLTSIQDVHAQQRQNIEEVKDNIMETVEKVVATETDIQGVKAEVEQLTESYRKIKSFLANNPDIDDKKIFENIQAIEKTLGSKFEKKHQELETKITSIERKCAEIEDKMETKQSLLEEIENLRKELLYRYKSFRTIPFSIDEKEEEFPIEFLYTETMIKTENKQDDYTSRSSNKGRRIRKENQQEKNLTSYKQIFKMGKRTILTGLFGSGTSTFCRKIVNVWCKLQENKIESNTDVEGSSTHESLQVAGQSTTDTSLVTEPSTLDLSEAKGSTTLDTSYVTGLSTHDSSNIIADENVLLKFDLLFFINSPAISNETKLTAVLCNQCIKREEEKEKDKIQNKLSKLLNDQPEKILIIFDGLDEMVHTPTCLVEVFKRHLYPGISVLMAMRPWTLSRLGLKPLSHYDLLLDIQGFSTDNSQKFVQKMFDMKSSMYEETKKNFLSKKDREILTSFKHVPLLLLFLVHIWYTEQSFPHKYTDLYNQIIDFLIRSWVKKAENNCSITMSYVESMNMHLKNFRETCLSSACNVAYQFLLEGQNDQSVLITQKELMRELGENSDVKLNKLLRCGIMSKVDFSPLGRNVSVAFLHISMQEYLASIYLVQDEDEFQKFLRSIETINDIFKCENLFIFISGLNVIQGHKVFTRICDVCDVDTQVIQYRQGGDNYEVIRDLNVVYKKCVNEMNEQQFIEMPDILITSDTDYKLLMSKLRPHFAKSLCVSRMRCDELDLNAMTSLISLRLEHVIKPEESSRSLCNSINSFTCLKVLYLVHITLDDGVLDLRSLTNLTHLKLFHVTMSAECSTSLCTSISDCTCLEDLNLNDIILHDGVIDLRYLTNLTSLTLRNVTMSKECNISLCSSISGCTHLKKLHLCDFILPDDVLDPQSLSNLLSLTLADITMSKDYSISLCRGINNCTQMEVLDLAFITLHDCVLNLKTLTNLTTLRLHKVIVSEKAGRPLYGSINILTHLKILNLSDLILCDGVLNLRSLTNLLNITLKRIAMSEACSRSQCSIINSCTCLEMLLLDSITLHYGELDLRLMSSLTHFTLLHVTMSADCSRSLCSSISGCTHLEDLNLNDITLHDGILDLRSLTNLINLTLVHVTMSEDCSRSLCRSISGYCNLENLHLKNIKLHDSILDLRSLTNMNSLRLDTLTMTKECSKYLRSSISSCTDLIEMELKNISLHDGVLDLSSLINLTNLTLENVTMLEECKMSLCNSFSGCTCLENLHLHNIKLHDGVLDLGSLTKMNSLRLNTVTMCEECSISLCSSISGYAHLEKLHLKSIKLQDGVFDLRSPTTITSIRLETVTMSDESLCCSMSSFTHLEELYLEDIRLQYGVRDLMSLTNLKDFTLLHLNMCGEYSRQLCSIINGYSHLENLHLKDIKLHDGVLDLRSLTSMNSLRLDTVTMSEECGRSLCNSISSFTQLKKLYVKNIKVHYGRFDLRYMTDLMDIRVLHETMPEEFSRSLCCSISGCAHLENLTMKNIKLHDGVLDLSSLTYLKDLTLVDVTMSKECSRSLHNNISRCTGLIKMKLKFIAHQDGLLDLNSLNKLTDLTLDKVTMLEELEEICMPFFSSITFLENLCLHNIELHDRILDLSSLTNLTNLTLDNVTMLEECSISLCKSISGCTSLEKLYLYNIKIDGILDLSSLTKLTHFILDNVKKIEECMMSLCSSINGCICLKNMHLHNINLQNSILDLSSLTNLTSLTLDNVTMLEECSISLCNSISGCTSLVNLYLHNIELVGILDLSSLTKLTDFILDDVKMIEECTISLCTGISGCICLKNLCLCNIRLNDGVLDMRFLTYMNSLRLCNVTMSEECSKSLCNDISSFTHLKKMELMYISLHDGVLDLSSLTNLTEITLDNVTMSKECRKSLYSSLSRCTDLTKMKLKNVLIQDVVLDLSSLTNLTDLALVHVVMSEDDECRRSLCSNISSFTHLKKMKLKNMSLHDGVLDLNLFTNLTDLTLNGVTMSEECSETICSSMNGCSCLENLHLSNIQLHYGIIDLTSLTNLISLTVDKVSMSNECHRSLINSAGSCNNLLELDLTDFAVEDGNTCVVL